MALLQQAAQTAIRAIRAESSADATDIEFISGPSKAPTETVASCIIWPEGNTESRGRGGQAGGIVNRWQCLFMKPELPLPPRESRCIYADQSMRLLRITNYYNELYIGDLVAST